MAEPSAREWLRRLQGGELSARELTRHYMDRIEQADPRLNAVVALEPEVAMAQAAAADRARGRGEERPLLGLPVTIKDSLEVAGMVSTGGSAARAGFRPHHDATAVARLRAAGAVILAKTNCPEYSASYETDNALHGRTNHPLDPERTPGGSSGGEAALAGADATPLGLGTDGGGSIRVPAHYCGVVGLRPTVGRVPDTGSWPATRASGYMDFYCVGPIARSVDDAALVLPVLAGPDGVDPHAVPAPLHDPAGVEVGRLRVGWFTHSPGVPVTEGTVSAVAGAARALAGAGAELVKVEPPWEPNPTALFFAATSADGGLQMREAAAAAGRHHAGFADLVAAAAEHALSAAEWFAVQREIYGLRARVRRLLTEVDALLSPVVAGPAPLHGMPPAGIPREQYAAFRAFDFVHLYAIGGVPAASVPVGVEDGLPVGVQVAGPPFREDVVLAVAGALESA